MCIFLEFKHLNSSSCQSGILRSPGAPTRRIVKTLEYVGSECTPVAAR